MNRGNSEAVAAELRQRIGEGSWSDGGRLPPERTIAEELGVARNTVRRALDRLEQDGLLTRHVGRGTYLREAGDEDPLLGSVQRMRGASPADMMGLRILLEPSAAAFAAANAPADKLAEIRQAHERALTAIDMLGFEEWDGTLHRLILSCTRNGLLREIHGILGCLRDQAAWYELKQRSFSAERREVYCAQHEEIVRALERRLSEDAQAAMRAHLLTVKKNMLGS